MASDQQKFMDLTGADESTANALISAASGDLERALALHFDTTADMENESTPAAGVAATAPAAPPALPAESAESLVGDILSHARQEEGEDKPSSSTWGGSGRTLGGSDAEPSSTGVADAASLPVDSAIPERRNPKKVRVIFWSDGFTVEDVTAEEEAAAAAALAEKNAPRRTGVVGLGSSRELDMPQMPKIPELRPYEDNSEFMEDLKQGVPPLEFRETDLSSGTPRPRPVDIMLGDMRPQAYPAEALKRMMPQVAQQAAPKKATMRAFTGQGRTLADEVPAATSGAAASTLASGTSESWQTAERIPPTVDAEAPTTEVQVRLAGSPPQRFKLNKKHTVADLKCLVELALANAGHAPRAYVLSAGFPPKPLSDDEATLEAAGLLSAAVSHRWT
eukprot:CAMPEP_0115848616 /NCGR_PEP_ID=MMETSP0287-20121206/11017_1 /TAXON_ID=412157 /ORGANISM="Chrysochromulina rotalis, Strain UIO044" /LENGTH=391 /DNA_ID=CAMNT_0003302541 /DNA_START=20 /DNA_END=1195 /DNA_ORIENTATION=-